MKIELNSGAIITNISPDLAGRIMVVIAEAPGIAAPPPESEPRKKYQRREKSADPATEDEQVSEPAPEGKHARLTEHEKQNIIASFKAGDTVRIIAKKFDVSTATVYRLTLPIGKNNP